MNKVGQSKSSSGIKGAYEHPRLRRYGDVGSLTQAVGTMGGTDGGPAGMNKKSL